MAPPAADEDSWPDDEGPQSVDLDEFGDDEQTDTLRCRHCGEEIFADADRCPVCGKDAPAGGSLWAGRPIWWLLLAVIGILMLAAMRPCRPGL